jgi:hypothetical protein
MVLLWPVSLLCYCILLVSLIKLWLLLLLLLLLVVVLLYDVLCLQAGSKCVCVADGLPTWVCELMVVKPTVQEAIDFIKQIEESLDIPITPITH